MKYTFHVPTEQYGFVEIETDSVEELLDSSIKDAVGAYKAISEASNNPTPGVGAKEFAEIVTDYIKTGQMVNGGDEYDRYSFGQKAFIKELTKLIRAKS